MTASFYKQFFRRHHEILVVGVAIVLVALFVTISRGMWASPYNLASVLQVTATLGIMALAERTLIEAEGALSDEELEKLKSLGYVN